ncbi:MAG: TM0106 family RecB-like putative nuclease [Gemmatimonadota bacterium]
MQVQNNQLIFSATDLSNFLACPHLTLLSRLHALGERVKPHFDDPGIKVVQERGLAHERNYLASLREAGNLQVADLTSLRAGDRSVAALERHASATVDAMRGGAGVIYQGALFDGTWLGYPDFLVRVERPGNLGTWSYEVVDTKLARSAKAGALLQVLLYSDLLSKAQGIAPEYVRLALGGPDATNPTFRVKDYSAYFRSIRKRFLDAIVNAPAELPTAVDPVLHCALCDWDVECTRERRDVDHLDFVAGISGRNRQILGEHGVTTLEGLATLSLTKLPKVDGMSTATLSRIQHQARLQYDARTAGKPGYELLKPVVENQGLAALPPPSPGDLFFDLEGDPYAFDTGIEYLFGVADINDRYDAKWSLDRPAEKKTFEWFMDFVIERLDKYPDLHIYHYAAYEPTALKKLAVRHDGSGSPDLAALKRLAGRYDTRIEELDRLLRGRVFVDLYRVVKQSLRASVESYSIKKMEAFYGFTREVDMRAANHALANFEAWLNLGGKPEEGEVLLREIEGYNRDDVLSTRHLRDWLENLRSELSEGTGGEVPRPTFADPEPPKELTEKIREVRDVMEQLLAGVPNEPEQRTRDQQSHWLIAQMLEWHRRESKSMWWQYYEWLEMNEEQLLENRSTLSGLEYVKEVGPLRKSIVYRYSFPPQEHAFRPGKDTRDPSTQKSAGSVVAIDELHGTIDLSRGKGKTAAHPRSILPFDFISDEVLRNSLLRIGKHVAERGSARDRFPAAMDLLQGIAPRVGQDEGSDLMRSGEDAIGAAGRLVLALDHSILPIQGPPGAGKTHTAAHMILALLKAGRKVGITATSHKVISNLLGKVCEEAAKSHQKVAAIQKADDDQRCPAGEVVGADSNEEILNGLVRGEFLLAAGTAWLWAREDMTNSVDVLFIDEAGQFSLANALAVAPAAGSVVLLGDPRQLEQPQQGLHPPGAEISAMDHLLAGHETMPVDRGVFLDQTWRLHPRICAFTSELYYEDRLSSRPGLERQQLHWSGDSSGTGLRWDPVRHEGNQNESAEEVTRICDVVTRLLTEDATWTNRDGEQRKLTLGDILVVSPYNAQVAAIAALLPQGSRVGTVDKFQGQEAPVVIYSMATSAPGDAPRGMEFLYSPNRLNVATSRARCLVILVANGELLFPECRTPEQMRLANGLCRYRELAQDLA